MLTGLQIALLFVLFLVLLLFYFIYLRPRKAAIGASQSFSYDFALTNAVLAKGKRIMIFAPHQDDEVLMWAGVITHAVTNGADVNVVVITNGDKKGRKTGLTRIRETLKAMEYLGLHQEDIVFLGYGSTTKESDSFMNRLCEAKTDITLVSSNVGTETYSVPEAPEYHFQKHGVHAPYNRLTLRQDLEAVIKEYNPDHIFAASLYDTHPEHAILYRFIVAAIVSVKREYPAFSPILHEYVIHVDDGDDHWPTRERNSDPLVPFSKPTAWAARVPLEWEKREIFTVPLAMQKLPRSKNPKYLAISKYRSQRPAANKNYLFSYVKLDEIFWATDFADIAVCEALEGDNTLCR